MEAAASSAFRHHEQHLSQDCGDRSRGNGLNWRLALHLSVSSSAVSLLPELPSVASGPGRRSQAFFSRCTRFSTPLILCPRSLNPSSRAHVLFTSPDLRRYPLQCSAPVRTLLFSVVFFLCEQHRILLYSILTVQVLEYLSLPTLETPASCNFYFDDSHRIALGNRI